MSTRSGQSYIRLISAAIAEGATTPAATAVGSLAWSTTLNTFVRWSGTAWNAVAGSSGGSQVIAGDGVTITGDGTVTTTGGSSGPCNGLVLPNTSGSYIYSMPTGLTYRDTFLNSNQTPLAPLVAEKDATLTAIRWWFATSPNDTFTLYVDLYGLDAANQQLTRIAALGSVPITGSSYGLTGITGLTQALTGRTPYWVRLGASVANSGGGNLYSSAALMPTLPLTVATLNANGPGLLYNSGSGSGAGLRYVGLGAGPSTISLANTALTGSPTAPLLLYSLTTA